MTANELSVGLASGRLRWRRVIVDQNNDWFIQSWDGQHRIPLLAGGGDGSGLSNAQLINIALIPSLQASLNNLEARLNEMQAESGGLTEDEVRAIVSELLLEIPTGGNATETEMGESITVSNAVGGWNVGDIIPSDANVHEVIQRMLNPVIPPVYLPPLLTLNGSTPLAREIGEFVTPTLTPNFTQRNGGAISQYRLSRNGVNILTQATATAHTDAEFQLSENTTYQAQADFGQGAILNDSAGNPHPQGRIEAGTVTSSNVQYLPRRMAFFGHDTLPNEPETSDDIRSLQGSFMHPVNNTTMVANVPIGSQFVCFAYPSNLRPITSIIQSGLNMDVKDGFTETTIQVEGANGFDSIDYRIYYTVTEFPFGALTTFTATI